MRIRKPRKGPSRFYIVCAHVKGAAQVHHVKLYDDTPGLARHQKYGEITCRRTQGPDTIEESSLVEEAVIREMLPGLLPER